MKKYVSFILVVAMILTFFSFGAYSAPYTGDSYPESAHPYSNNLYQTFDYQGPEGAAGLFVTFSEDTFVEDTGNNHFISDITLNANIIAVPKIWGDYISVLDSEGNSVGLYTGAELAGETVFVPGDSFRIILSTDSSVTYYGFKVTDVTPCDDDTVGQIRYHSGDEVITKNYLKTKDVKLTDSANIEKPEDGMSFFVGWATEEGGPIKYNGGDVLSDTEIPSDLYACSCHLQLREDEVFSFVNASYYFDVDGKDGYTMTEEDYASLQRNLYREFGIGPYPTIPVSIGLKIYSDSEFRGSCYGMSTVTALQHFGKINIFGRQNVSTMRQLTADTNVVSFINYYQGQAATSWLVENKAGVPGTYDYRLQLENCYKSAEAGNVVLFTFYTGSAFITPGHTVLVTGAFTDAEGNHILVCYDCNHSSWYRQTTAFDIGYYAGFKISPDYSSIERLHYEESIGAINWTDNFDQFDSFNLDGEKNFSAWYNVLFAHMKDNFINFFTLLARLFK